MCIFAAKMLRLTRFINRTLSVRISLTVVLAIATLLTAALFIMFRYSRKALKEEALQKAGQTLEATVQHIDNILLNVEQASGNIYWDLLLHLDEPDKMSHYARLLLEVSPYITGCAIAFEPSYYKEHEHYFMTYFHRTAIPDLRSPTRSLSGKLNTRQSPIIQAETFGNKPYTEQIWYTMTMQAGHPCWINPMKDANAENEAIISFCLPIYGREGKPVGVLGVDVALSLLSEIMLGAKPSPHSYATMLGSDGAYIVHPDSTKVAHHTIYTSLSEASSAQEAALAMLSGETGYRQFKLDGTNNYVFYKPFKRSAVPGRSMEDIGWSIGIVYPEEDIFGDYNRLLYIVLSIAVIGLLLMLVLCQWFTHRQLLPLRLLTKSAHRITEGHFDDPIPVSEQKDEVGRLQNHFRQMQLALANNMGELKRLNSNLRQQSEVLTETYEHAKEADRMKTAFLHNMTNQMLEPVKVIQKNVSTLYNHCQDMEPQETSRLEADIRQQGETITHLLNELLKASEKS